MKFNDLKKFSGEGLLSRTIALIERMAQQHGLEIGSYERKLKQIELCQQEMRKTFAFHMQIQILHPLC